MGAFLINICRNDYYNILTLIFGNFWWHLEISGIWKLRIGKSGNSRKLASFGQYQYIGYFSHSVQVTGLDFYLRISNFQFFLIFSGNILEIWKFSQICFFDQFLCKGHHFHLISVTEIDFALRISNFKLFWIFFLEIS